MQGGKCNLKSDLNEREIRRENEKERENGR
jgi:hypothetical protein